MELNLWHHPLIPRLRLTISIAAPAIGNGTANTVSNKFCDRSTGLITRNAHRRHGASQRSVRVAATMLGLPMAIAVARVLFWCVPCIPMAGPIRRPAPTGRVAIAAADR
jgi:hypothetical protein